MRVNTSSLASPCGCQHGDRVKTVVFGCQVCSVGLLAAFGLDRGDFYDAGCILG